MLSTRLSVSIAIILTTAPLMPSARADQPTKSEKIPILLDTDIGSDVDDAFALALALASPELDIKAITTVAGPADDRAWIVCRFLPPAGYGPIPVAFGGPPQPNLGVDGQIQYRRH